MMEEKEYRMLLHFHIDTRVTSTSLTRLVAVVEVVERKSENKPLKL